VRALLCVVALTAACGGGAGEVGPRTPVAIVLLPNDPLLTSGQTLQLTATVVDAAGSAIPGEPITFTTSNPDMLTVSATGLVTSVGPVGDAQIVAVSGQLMSFVRVRVGFPPSAVFVDPAHLELSPTEDAALFVTVTDEHGGPIMATITLRSTDPAIATVEPSGRVTAVQVGTAAIIVSSPNRTDATVPVVVAQAPLNIVVTPASVWLPPGAE
jgi:uncharacterized protein YjdB